MKKQIATLGILGLLACGAQAEPLTSQTDGPVLVADHHMEATSPGTVVNVAANAGNFKTLVAAIQAANLQEALKGDGPFTILAPTGYFAEVDHSFRAMSITRTGRSRSLSGTATGRLIPAQRISFHLDFDGGSYQSV